MPLPLLHEISGAVHLALPGLTAGWQADEIQVNFETLEFATDRHIRLFALFNKGTALL